jgi:apolipoprotein N-acyltransferase
VLVGLVAAAPLPGSFAFALIAATALMALLDGQRALTGALIGFGFGVGWFIAWLEWLRVIGDDAWIGLAAFCALYAAAMGAGQAMVLRLRWGPLWAACLWVAQEAVRDRLPFGGFPWARLASGTEPPVALTGPLVLGGFPAATFTIALSGALIARWLRRRPADARNPLIAVGVLFVLLVVPPVLIPGPTSTGNTDDASDDTLAVALIQGDVPGEGLDFLGRQRQVLNNHVRETLKLAAEVKAGRQPQPDLVVWPENSSDIDPFTDPQASAAIDRAVRAIGAPTLIGAVLDVPTDATLVRNAAILWDPETGAGEIYVKQKPVPFGEYIPYRSLIGGLASRLDRIPRDFIAGDRTGTFEVAGTTIGVAICFEVADDSVLRDAVRDGAELLVVMTNNATYASTDQPEQQFAITRARAVEHRRSTVVAATTGITAAVSGGGGVVASVPQNEPGSLVVTMPLSGDLTPSDRVGAVGEWALTIVGLVAVIVGLRRARRLRSTPPSSHDDVPIASPRRTS